MFDWLQGPGRRQALTAAVVVFLVGLSMGYAAAWWRMPPVAPADPENGGPAVDVDVRDGLPMVTRQDTIIRYESFHTPCRLLITDVTHAGHELGGFTQEALAAEVEPWLITGFSDQEVVLHRTTDVPCPETGGVYTLGIHNGKVVVFEGSETGGEIYAETELDAGGLLPGDREVLEAGIIVESEAEIWQYLEGLEHGRS